MADVCYEKKGASGGSLLPMNQDLSMNNHKITRLATRTQNDDAATKKYVDDKPKGMTKATADNFTFGWEGGRYREPYTF